MQKTELELWQGSSRVLVVNFLSTTLVVDYNSTSSLLVVDHFDWISPRLVDDDNAFEHFYHYYIALWRPKSFYTAIHRYTYSML